MPPAIWYTCEHELLPMVEAALAANGYMIEAPRRQQVNGTTVLVLAQGAAIVTLIETAQSDWAEIEVSDDAPATAIAFLESLPIALNKQPQALAQPRSFAATE